MFGWFKARVVKVARQDPYGIAPRAPGPDPVRIDSDPATAELARQIMDARPHTGTGSKSEAERQALRPSYALNDPVYWAGRK